MTLRRYARLYGVLALLRTLIAFTSTSAIHPDEHFQNPEIAASTVFEYARSGDGLLRTWEWEGTAPCRSIVPVLGSTGWMFALLRLAVGDKPTGYALFLAQRQAMLLFSFLIDYLIWSTSNGSPIPLLMFASSPVIFTFLLRPFSNSLETLLLAAALYLAPRSTKRDSSVRLIAFGAALALGVFTRITFPAFAGPLVLDVAQRLASQLSRSPRSPLLRLAKRSIPIVLSFAITSLACAITDTIYFSSSELAPLSRLVLAPLNLLRYNLSAAHLAEHGLHPRYMHVLVNWPMLFGVGLAIVPTAAGTLRGAKDADSKAEERRRVWLYLASFLLPTFLLSLQPHQEPRFLIPLVVPLALLAPYSSLFRSGTKRARKWRRAFWALWLVHSTIFTVLFGYLHQGGLLPALFALNGQLRDPTTALGASSAIDIVFWRTFMPPRHLLLPTVDGDLVVPAVTVTDLAGASFDTLVSTMLDKIQQQSSVTDASHLLVAPAYTVHSLELLCSVHPTSATPHSFCLEPALVDKDGKERTFGLHVDMDRLGELRHATWRTVGVGMWTVRRRTSRDG